MSRLAKVLFGTGMFGLGVITGFLVGKKVLDEEYRKDVADIQAFYKSKIEELGVMEEGFELPEEDDDDDEDKDEDSDDEEDDSQSFQADIEDALASYRGERRRVVIDYTKYSKPSLEDLKNRLSDETAFTNSGGVSVIVQADGSEKLGHVDDNEEEEEYVPSDDPAYEAELEQQAEDYARRRLENMNRGEPYLIEWDEYRDGPEDYDRQALYYYSKDRTLCEDDDAEVKDEEECVGFDYEDKLDMQTTCWVRNDKLRVLYEIHRIDDSYKKAVLGISETPREREFRIQGRRKQALDDGFKAKRG